MQEFVHGPLLLIWSDSSYLRIQGEWKGLWSDGPSLSPETEKLRSCVLGLSLSEAALVSANYIQWTILELTINYVPLKVLYA